MDKHEKLSQALLKERFDYNPETGIFTHRPKRGKRAGMTVGSAHRLGYRVVCMGEGTFYMHRLAWMYVYGVWPEGELDHINGDRSDNRIANLRPTSRAANMQNIRKVRRNKTSSQYLGVSRDPRMKSRPWRGVVNKDGKNYDCGYWATEEEAHAAYLAKKRELHEGCTL